MLNIPLPALAEAHDIWMNAYAYQAERLAREAEDTARASTAATKTYDLAFTHAKQLACDALAEATRSLSTNAHKLAPGTAFSPAQERIAAAMQRCINANRDIAQRVGFVPPPPRTRGHEYAVYQGEERLDTFGKGRYTHSDDVYEAVYRSPRKNLSIRLVPYARLTLALPQDINMNEDISPDYFPARFTPTPSGPGDHTTLRWHLCEFPHVWVELSPAILASPSWVQYRVGYAGATLGAGHGLGNLHDTVVEHLHQYFNTQGNKAALLAALDEDAAVREQDWA